jgi:hypothetical protein
VGRSWALGYGVMALVFLAARWGLSADAAANRE